MVESMQKNFRDLYEIEEAVFFDIGKERMLQMLETAILFNTLFEKKLEDLDLV